MNDRQEKKNRWGPKDYWHIGPVYINKLLALAILIALSAAVLLIVGFPTKDPPGGGGLPAYRYDDPALAGVSGVVQVLDAQNCVRYTGDVKAGAYTGRGKVFDTAGKLLYDGPVVDGVYQGADAKVYQNGELIYSGDMAGNLYEGQGRRIDPDTGEISVGQFSRGVFEGQGQQFDANGVLRREGTFSAGLLHGDGLEYTPGGKLLYQGQFWRGVYHGQGTLYHTLLGVPCASGTFVYGELKGQGKLYHPSGQVLYEGQVYGKHPRADAFLGLSLAEVEGAFATHWLLYTSEEASAFVYPYFQLMFITESPLLLGDETLSPEMDKGDISITQVLSYQEPLPGTPQPEENAVLGQHPYGWREWYSDFANREKAEGAHVWQSSQYVWRFTPDASAQDEGWVKEVWAEGAGLETMTVRKKNKDMVLWYQTARWREEL